MKSALGCALLIGLLGSRAALAQSAANIASPHAAPSPADVLGKGALVVVVADEPGDAVSSRLERDLRSLGLAVIVLSATLENSSGEAALERVARGFGAIAAVRVLANAQGSQLWLFEPVTNRTLTRSSTSPQSSSADPNEVALGVLELLRASILELHSPPRPAPAAAPPAAPAAPTSARGSSTPTFALSGGLAAELGLRSVGPSLSTLWAAWVNVGGCFGLRGFAALPLLAESSDLPDGRVDLEALVLGAGLSCGSSRRDIRLSPRVSLGLASARVVTRGAAIDPRRSSSGTTWLGGGYGMLGVSLHVTHDVRLNLDGIGVLLPTPAVIIASGREVGTWGSPGGLVSLGVEVLAEP